MMLLVLLGLPLAAALLSLAPLGRRFAAGVTLAATTGSLLAALVIAGAVAGRGTLVAVPDWIAADGLSALLLLLIAFVGMTAALYSWGYMPDEPHATPRALRLYYCNFNFFVFSLLAVPALVEPLLVWIAVEITALSSILLVSFDNTHEALEAAWKYAVLMIMGGMIALLGFLTLYWAFRPVGGPFTWGALTAAAPRLAVAPLRMAFVLVLVGFGTKSGFVPLHTWLPDAHSQAPTPVCSILSGVKTATALYVILRLIPIVSVTLAANLDHVMVAVGLVSLGVAAFLLAQVHDYKRLFAYSTVEHMGIVLTAAGLGTPLGHLGAAYQIVTHGLTKSFCFFAAGAVLLLVGTREIRDVRDLVRQKPLAAAALLLGALAIAGAPPFPVFLSEFTILRAGLASGHVAVVTLLAVFIAVAFFGIMFRVSRMVFGVAGDASVSAVARVTTLPGSCAAAIVVAVAPLFVLGVYTPATLHTLLRLAAAALQR